MGIVNELELIQVRHGDVIVLKPKKDVSDAKLHAVFEQLKTWLEYRRIKINIAIMPHDVDILIMREDTRP